MSSGNQLQGATLIDGGGNGDVLLLSGTSVDLEEAILAFERVALRTDNVVITVDDKSVAGIIDGYSSPERSSQTRKRHAR